jgi:hypothetical protein
VHSAQAHEQEQRSQCEFDLEYEQALDQDYENYWKRERERQLEGERQQLLEENRVRDAMLLRKTEIRLQRETEAVNRGRELERGIAREKSEREQKRRREEDEECDEFPVGPEWSEVGVEVEVPPKLCTSCVVGSTKLAGHFGMSQSSSPLICCKYPPPLSFN